jgi:hypothetical protein
MVEARGVEPLSESLFPGTSTYVATTFKISYHTTPSSGLCDQPALIIPSFSQGTLKIVPRLDDALAYSAGRVRRTSSYIKLLMRNYRLRLFFFSSFYVTQSNTARSPEFQTPVETFTPPCYILSFSIYQTVLFVHVYQHLFWLNHDVCHIIFYLWLKLIQL